MTAVGDKPWVGHGFDSARILAQGQGITFLHPHNGLLQVWLIPGIMDEHWLQAKLALVLILSGLHGYFAMCVGKFARDANDKPARFYRILNEVPAVLMALIVILVIVQPF